MVPPASIRSDVREGHVSVRPRPQPSLKCQQGPLQTAARARYQPDISPRRPQIQHKTRQDACYLMSINATFSVHQCFYLELIVFNANSTHISTKSCQIPTKTHGGEFSTWFSLDFALKSKSINPFLRQTRLICDSISLITVRGGSSIKCTLTSTFLFWAYLKKSCLHFVVILRVFRSLRFMTCVNGI